MNLTPGLVKSVMGQAENRTKSGFIGSQIEFTKSVNREKDFGITGKFGFDQRTVYRSRIL